MEEVRLNALQQEFMNRALAGENIFLSGKAGTGKSTVIKKFIEEVKGSVICCAPTGIAAINIGGVTLHSAFGIKIGGVAEYSTASYLKPVKKEVLRHAKVIIIDEVSMLRADVLDALDYTLNKNHLGSLKDKQIIFVGDMKQLPVVVDKNTEAMMFSLGYKGVTFQDAKIYSKLKANSVDLEQVVRQSDNEFIDALNVVREGGKPPYFKQFVYKNPKGIIIAPHNATVSAYNQNGISQAKGELKIFEATYEGLATENDFGFEKTLKLKDGVPVMYLKNEENNSLLRNGTLGTIEFSEDDMFIKVQDVRYRVDRQKVTKNEYVYDEDENELKLKEVGSCEQYPIKLAFALSIHKSQGLTFDEVTVDLSKPCFY